MQRGITLLEVIMAVAILALISVVLIQPLASFRDEQLLTGHSERVLSLLSEARNNTLSSQNASQYGVHLQTSRAVLFEGTSFAQASSTLKDITFHKSVIADDINISGGNDVVFERLTGETNNDGSIVLQLTHNASSTRTIIIEPTGVVSVQE